MEFSWGSEIKNFVLLRRKGIVIKVAVSSAFRFYKGGIFDSTDRDNKCTQKATHAIYLNGWGKGYWRAKNTWGERFWIKGHIHISSNDELVSENTTCICGKIGDQNLKDKKCKYSVVV